MLDWKEKMVKSDPNYPAHCIIQVELDLWSTEMAEQYVVGRIQKHEEAAKDISKFPCSDKARWKGNLRCKEYCDGAPWCQQWNGGKK